MRVVFFGTPSWAVPSLEALLGSDADVVAVVTNPDRPAGRGMKVRPSPVKEEAERAGLPILQPEKARDPALGSELAALAPDVAVVVAYGKILSGDLLAVPPKGFVNVHFSILPEYRGAAPVQRAVMDGRSETGVSIMVLTEGMDEGPVLAIASTPIGPRDTAGMVGDRLAVRGASLLVETLPAYVDGSLEPREQDHAAATYASKLTNEETRIDWGWDAERIDPFVRGLNPVPRAWTEIDGKRLSVDLVTPVEGERLAPGELGEGPGFVVGTGSRHLTLDEVQLAGKKRMTGEELLRGLRLSPGTRLS